MLCHQGLTDPNMLALWKASLESGYILQLCRDEVLHIHSYATTFFESLRRYLLGMFIKFIRSAYMATTA